MQSDEYAQGHVRSPAAPPTRLRHGSWRCSASLAHPGCFVRAANTLTDHLALLPRNDQRDDEHRRAARQSQPSRS